MHQYLQSVICCCSMLLFCLFSFISFFFTFISFAITARRALKLQIADSTAFITSYKLRGASENERTHTHTLIHARYSYGRLSALQTMHASLGCSLPHTTKKTKTKTRDRNRNRADAADAVASRACTGSGQRQAERNSTQWAFVIMCKIHHTSLACLPASQPTSVLLRQGLDFNSMEGFVCGPRVCASTPLSLSS